MANRAEKILDRAILRTFTIESGQTVTIGKTVRFGSSDTTIQDAGSGSDVAFAVVLQSNSKYANASTGVIDPTISPATATTPIEVALLGNTIVPMKVGTGGTTRGKSQKVVSDGITDAAANGGGTTDVETIGIAMQSGVAGDLVGVMTGKNSRVSA